MTTNGWLQIGLFFFLIAVLARPVGMYLTLVFERRRTWLDTIFAPVERLLYAATGSSTVNVEPLRPSELTQMRPCIRWTSSRQM